MKSTVTTEYLMGIKEGRAILNGSTASEISITDRIDNLNRTIKGFASNTPVGQMLRGERDFWLNQAKRTA